jgi:phage protein U
MAAPMIDDLELKAVQHIRQETDQDFVRQRVAGLDGTLHQKLGRSSHRVVLAGLLLPDSAAADLKQLQQKAAAGAEVTFTADITTALSLQKMVIESFRAKQGVGRDGQIAYVVALAESPPLPPPAELSPFGGLGDFGLGGLGFDPAALGGVLGAIADQAGAIMGAVDAALDAVQQLSALAKLTNLGGLGNPVKPVLEKVSSLAAVGVKVAGLGGTVKGLLG